MAFIGGLVLYALSEWMTRSWRPSAAATWSWFLIVASGYAANRIIPRENFSRVNRVLLAMMASVGSVIAVMWLLATVFQLHFEEGATGAMVLFGAAEASIAVVLYLPIYLLRERLGGLEDIAYLVSGSLVPAAASFVYLFPPDSSTSLQVSATVAAAFAILGAAGAAAFAVVVRANNPR